MCTCTCVTTDLRGEENGMAAAEYDSDDVEMEIEDEEDETTVHKDNSKTKRSWCSHIFP